MVVHAHYPHGETRVQRQAEALLRQGYEVDVVCLRGKSEAPVEDCNGVRVIRLPIRYQNYDNAYEKFIEYFRFFMLAMLKLPSLYWQQRYRTIQLHNLPDFIVFAGWIPRLFGAKLILDLHDLMPEFYRSRYGGGGESWIVRLLDVQQKLSCGFADHVVTVSDHWRQTLIEQGLPPQKCSVVMNVADDNIFNRPEGPKFKPDSEDDFRLVYHGSITYRYGIDLVIKAIAKVRNQIPKISLIIHGGGELFPELQKMAKDLALEDKIKFSSKFVTVEQLPEIINTGDVGLAPYRDDVFTRGIVPTKLMEYAALGMPAIAARTPAIEAYFHDSMVEFFTPGDEDDLARCILRLYQDRHRLAELTRGTEIFNQKYNWTKLGNEYVYLIDRLGNGAS
jgi:glycosyltransferase involved in cell wall biosynthesis